ncbi:MAG: NUDIX hydrolase [Parcubacteria group bacterium]|nr:NUDIX hydrolase [Parcubacteria group bacterium]
MIDKKFYKNLPRKRVASAALFLNKKKEILIVKPSYKPNWTLPGGIVDKDESPLAGCRREVKEEIGLYVKIKDLLLVDYTHNREKGDALKFIFFGGILGIEKIKCINIDQKEISEYKFSKPQEAIKLLNPKAMVRVVKCLESLESGQPIYLES